MYVDNWRSYDNELYGILLQSRLTLVQTILTQVDFLLLFLWQVYFTVTV